MITYLVILNPGDRRALGLNSGPGAGCTAGVYRFNSHVSQETAILPLHPHHDLREVKLK